MFRKLPLVLSIFWVPTCALAWGCSGHHIVAWIAEGHLSANALAEVSKLLKAEPIDANLSRYCKDEPADPFVASATWADDVKRAEGTATWHYIDIPLGIPQGDASKYCEPVGPLRGGARAGCLLTALDNQLSVLKGGSPAEHVRALRYLIHLVGDLHQPLHVSDNADRGGNCVPVFLGPDSLEVNLHSAWDSAILETALQQRHLTPQEFGWELDQRYQRNFDDWANKERSPEQWSWGVHEIASKTTYGKLQPNVPVEPANTVTDCVSSAAKIRGLHILLTAEYQSSAMQAIESLLAMAGYRLAGILNRTWP